MKKKQSNTKEEAKDILWGNYKTLRTFMLESNIWEQIAIIRAYDEIDIRKQEAIKYGDIIRADFYRMVERELDKLDFDEACPYEP